VKLPVEPERLRQLFPSLTDEDLDAYSEVTRTLLAEPRARRRRLAEVMAAAERGRDKEAAALALDDDERRAVAYLRALGKMQGRSI
jgi:septal ring factor EnvC (AmiA/AmiB activator)